MIIVTFFKFCGSNLVPGGGISQLTGEKSQDAGEHVQRCKDLQSQRGQVAARLDIGAETASDGTIRR